MVDTDTNQVSGIVSLPMVPFAVAANQNTGVVYFSTTEDIYAVDSATGSLLATIPVGASFLTADPCRNLLYASGGEGSVAVIDGVSNTVSGFIGGFAVSGPMQLDLCTNRLYVSDPAAGDIKVVDGAAQAVVAAIALEEGYSPGPLALNPLTQRLYVAVSLGLIRVIDTGINAVIGSLTTTAFDRLTDLVMNPATNMLYASGAYGGTRVYSGNTGETVTTIPVFAFEGALDPQTNQLYFASGETVTVVDGRTNEIEGTVSGLQEEITGIGLLDGCPADCPCPCAATGGQRLCDGPAYLYAADESEGLVHVYDPVTREEVDSLAIGGPGMLIAMDPTINRLYLYDGSAGQILIADALTGTVIHRVTEDAGAFAVNQRTHMVYYTNPNNLPDLGVINGLNPAAPPRHITVGPPTDVPYQLVAVNPAMNLIYAVDWVNNTLLAFGGNSHVPLYDYSLPQTPTALAVNPCTGEVFAALEEGGEHPGEIIVLGARLDFRAFMGPGTGTAYQLAVDSGTNALYTQDGDVYDLCALEHVSHLAVPGGGGDRIALDTANHLIYISSAEQGIISAFDGPVNTSIGQIDVTASDLAAASCGYSCTACLPAP